MLNATILRQRLDYDPETGLFIWKQNQRWPGKIAGRAKPPKNYWAIQIDGKRYYAHRLAWLYVYGEWPVSQIDHLDRDRLNNKIKNLRLASDTQNKANRIKYANNSTGVKGVTWDRSRNKWMAQISKNGQRFHLGRHNSREAAHAAYVEAATTLYGEFSCTE